MMEDFDRVVTDPRLTLAAAEAALAGSHTEPQLLFGEYICLASGGSTGRRGVFVFNLATMTEFFSIIMRPLVARMSAGGALPPEGITMAFVAAASPVHATGCGPKLAEGSPIRLIPVPVTLSLDEIVDRLNRIQPPILYGYPSMIARLARERRAGRLRIAPMAVTTTSETLLPEYRAEISAAFGVPIVDNFASTEGLVGASGPGEPVITLASDACIAELVDDQNRPVPPGTPSARVLVTNLYNRVQPLIRYELADSFTRQPDAAGHGHLRATVQGRSDEVLRYGSLDIHPLTVRSVLLKTAEISDYQVRQTSGGIDVSVQADAPPDLDRLSVLLRSTLARAGLPDPDVTVRVVTDLERHSQTGKLRRFIPA
jgi:phenylacetate-coenzyme A ligase PaaK-like adenylate-forming protein